MKIKITYIIFNIFLSQICLAQWQGQGTEEDPFHIYNLEDLHLIKENEINFDSYVDIHFNLMNDIDDALSSRIANYFYGYFHGKGHYISLGVDEETQYSDYFIWNVYGTIDSLSFEGVFNYVSLFTYVYGKLSHITCNVNYLWDLGEAYIFCEQNIGVIEYCVNNSDIESSYNSTICIFGLGNMGVLNSCINNGNITYNGSIATIISTASRSNFGKIINCINTGNVSTTNIPEWMDVTTFGFSGEHTLIYEYINCLNTGNFIVRNAEIFSGIASAGSNYRKIKISNCMNTGNLSGSDKTAGIFCNLYTGNFALDEPMIIENCVNTGAISGNVSAGGITSGAGLNTTTPPIIRNNLNLGKTSNYALFDWSEQVAFETFENNFYDKQLVPQTASPQGDILENNAAKGLLTTDITGFALQEILGNGWSYAEGRYPIPLGLENHPAVQLAATPIYLPYEDQDNYNTVDSVTCHFTLGTENNVEWTSNPSQIELIQSENELKGVLQTTGFANLSAYLDGFTKNILLNIKSICQPDYKKEEIQKTQITAYPNPTKDILYFNQASAYEIFDLQGKLVMKSNKPQNFVNTAELKPGMYIIKIGEEVIKFVVE